MPVKNFDTERLAKKASEEDRTFVLGGETFVAKQSVHPSVLTAYDRIGKDSTITETLEVVDDCILQMTEARDDAHGRYLQVRANVDDPITVDDLLDIVKWLLEAQTDRPTGQPSASGSGQTPTATDLTVVSSLPDTQKE